MILQGLFNRQGHLQMNDPWDGGTTLQSILVGGMPLAMATSGFISPIPAYHKNNIFLVVQGPQDSTEREQQG